MEKLFIETISGNIGDSDLSMPDVVALVKDSVVEITTETSVYNGRYVQSGAGSGVIIGKSEDGKTVYIATNNHVIAEADTINVRLTNGSVYAATLRGTDSTSDIAVITITVNEPVTVAQLGSSASLKVGESVIAIGNPLGELGGTVTNGIISALARGVEIDGANMTLLQTSAAVNPGNSGGGLFNMRGELIGIVNAKSSGENIDNIGFAIPVDTAYEIISELIEYGYVTGRVDAGLTLIDVTDTYTAWYYGVSTLVVYVYESKFTTDVQSGDRIVSVNGVEVSSSADIKGILGDCSVGDSVTVRVSRKGKQYDASIVLREYVPSGVTAAETTRAIFHF
jgi:serine protease Do